MHETLLDPPGIAVFVLPYTLTPFQTAGVCIGFSMFSPPAIAKGRHGRTPGLGGAYLAVVSLSRARSIADFMLKAREGFLHHETREHSLVLQVAAELDRHRR